MKYVTMGGRRGRQGFCDNSIKACGNKIRDNGGEGVKNIPNLRYVIYGWPFSLVQNMNLKGKYKKEVH
jgi:hypothetical protein